MKTQGPKVLDPPSTFPPLPIIKVVVQLKVNWLSFIFLRFLTITGCLVTEEKLISIGWSPVLNSCESSLLKPACNRYNPLSMMFLFFVVLFAIVAGSGHNRPNAGKSWDSWSAFYTTGSYKPPVNGITRYEMKTLSVRERIEIKLLGRQRLFKRNSYQIRRNEYSKDNFSLIACLAWMTVSF